MLFEIEKAQNYSFLLHKKGNAKQQLGRNVVGHG